MKRFAAAIAVAALIAVPICAEETIDQAVIAQIKIEGFQHSQVMDTLSWLSDVYGPRLTGSPGLQRAAEWARDRLAHWGLEHATLEPYGSIGRGWDLQHFDIEMTAPQFMRLTGYPRAWSPATPSPVTGTPIVVEVRSKADFERYRGKLRGAIVMNGRPAQADIGFKPEAERLSDEELKQKEGKLDPAPGSSPKSYWEEEAEFDKYLADAVDVWKFFADEGVAALIEPSAVAEDVRVDGFYDQKWHASYPAFVISREHYGRVMRMIDKKIPVNISLSARREVHRQRRRHQHRRRAAGYGSGVERRSRDARRSLRFVALGHRRDGQRRGSAAAMEAVRILKAIGVKPRRTIRDRAVDRRGAGLFRIARLCGAPLRRSENDGAQTRAREALRVLQSGQRRGPDPRRESSGQRSRASDLRSVVEAVQLPRGVDTDDAGTPAAPITCRSTHSGCQASSSFRIR